MTGGKPDSRFHKKELLFAIYYIAVALICTLCMIYAVLFGAACGHLPSDSMWSVLTAPLPIHIYYLTEKLFITFLPLLVVLNLHTLLFRRFLHQKSFTPSGNAVRVFLGVALAFPLLYVAVSLYFLSRFALGWPEIVIAWSGIASGFLVVYQLCISIVMSEKAIDFFSNYLSNPKNWVAFPALVGILAVSTLFLIVPLHKGYFVYFPSYEQFQRALPDLVARALVIGIVLPMMSFVSLYFSTKETA